MRRAPISPLLLLVGGLMAATACQDGQAAAGAIDDSTYVRAMGRLRRLHDDRLSNPLNPLPAPLSPGGGLPTPAQRHARDSAQRAREDSVRAVDSVARAGVLTALHVTPQQLMAPARSLAADPLHAQKITEHIGIMSQRLDSLQRVEKAARELKARADSAARDYGRRTTILRTTTKPSTSSR